MVAVPSSPPASSAQPCGACTAARRGPSRCWSWSWTAGKCCRGPRAVPRGAARREPRPVTQRAPLRRCPASPAAAAGSCSWGEPTGAAAQSRSQPRGGPVCRRVTPFVSGALRSSQRSRTPGGRGRRRRLLGRLCCGLTVWGGEGGEFQRRPPRRDLRWECGITSGAGVKRSERGAVRLPSDPAGALGGHPHGIGSFQPV